YAEDDGRPRRPILLTGTPRGERQRPASRRGHGLPPEGLQAVDPYHGLIPPEGEAFRGGDADADAGEAARSPVHRDAVQLPRLPACNGQNVFHRGQKPAAEPPFAAAHGRSGHQAPAFQEGDAAYRPCAFNGQDAHRLAPAVSLPSMSLLPLTLLPRPGATLPAAPRDPRPWRRTSCSAPSGHSPCLPRPAPR